MNHAGWQILSANVSVCGTTLCISSEMLERCASNVNGQAAVWSAFLMTIVLMDGGPARRPLREPMARRAGNEDITDPPESRQKTRRNRLCNPALQNPKVFLSDSIIH